MELYPLLPGESIELRAFPVDSSKRPRQTFFSSWQALDDEAWRLDETHDVYFGVAPRVPGPDGVLHGRLENVKRVPTVWCDMDAKGDRTKAGRLEQLESWAPTTIVDSGHGLHAYWQLGHAATPHDARTLMKRLAQHFGCDDTSDPTRILRWPGTINHKSGETAPVSLLYEAGPRTVVAYDSLARSLPELVEPVMNGSNHALRAGSIIKYGIPEGGTDIGGEHFDGRDAAMFELACYFRDEGCLEAEVLLGCIDANKHFSPPLDRRVVNAKVRSAFTREPALNITEVVEAPQTIVLPPTRLQTVSLHDLPPPVPVKWIEDPYFTANRLVLLDGEEGIGKSALCAMLAVKYSAERPFVWFTAEDDPQHDVAPRLRAAAQYYGVPFSDVHVHFVIGDPRYNADKPNLFDELSETLRELNANMLVFDPGRSFLGPREGQKDFSHNNEADIRPTLQKLARMTVDLGVGGVFGHHWNKNAGSALRYRTTGSGAYRQVVRHQVSLVWDHTIDDGVVGVHKSNVAATAGTLRLYALEVIDDQPVFVMGEKEDAATLELWASERSRMHRKAITVIEPTEIVEKVRDWAFENLAPGDLWPPRAVLMEQAGLSQAEAKLAVPILKEEDWVVRQGRTFIWQPQWTPQS